MIVQLCSPVSNIRAAPPITRQRGAFHSYALASQLLAYTAVGLMDAVTDITRINPTLNMYSAYGPWVLMNYELMPREQESQPAKLLTLAEVADYLRVHPSTVYRLLKREDLPAFKVGKDWRFKIDAIDEWCIKQAAPGRKRARSRYEST